MGELRPSIFCGCIAFFIIGLAVIASMNQSVLAADSLQVSGQTNKLTVPQSGPSGAAPSQPFNPFKRDSSAPAAFDEAPTIMPSNPRVGRNRHFEELRDRQMNWIFLTPDTFNKGPNPADMFDKQEEPSGPSAGNSKVIENFWKEQDHQNGIDSPSRSRRKADDKDAPALAEPSGSLSPRLSQKDATLNWNGLFRQKEQKETANGSLQPTEGIFSGLFNAPMDGSAGLSGSLGLPGMTDSQKDQFDDLTKLLRGGSSRGYGLNRSIKDPTASDGNPASAKTVDDYSQKRLPGLAERLPGNLAGFSASHQNLFQDPNAKILGEPTFKPAYSPPTRYVQPQPAVLELPKRKF